MDLQEHVKRLTAAYKYPRKVEFAAELPKTISSKIRRVDLRQLDGKPRLVGIYASPSRLACARTVRHSTGFVALPRASVTLWLHFAAYANMPRVNSHTLTWELESSCLGPN
jgi:hypothetical protein